MGDQNSSQAARAPVPRFSEPVPPSKAVETTDTSSEATAPAATVDRSLAPPPPPKFAPPPPARAGSNAAKAAAIAAAQAAQHATPAQRERMIMEAASAALAQHTAGAQSTAADQPGPSAGSSDGPQQPTPPKAPGSYQPPSWGEEPTNVPYVMEVMKSGAIVSTLDLRALCSDNGRGYVTFGRAPDNDVLLDHPSSSRLHAIVQFNAKDGAAFLYDPGSTHGTSLNKKRIPPNEHVPLHVGDQLVFGESSRVHILGGPADLMPEEGPSREQRRQAAAMELYRRRKEREAEVAKSQMAAAIAKGAAGAAGVTWGMREDAEEEIDEAGDVIIDWRAHAATKGLTEKQQKIADKIRKRELRIQNLQKECDRIRTKERAMEELSAGQASTLVRNEQEMDKAVAEMEELEETLVESIRDSIQGKRKAAGDHDKTARKRRRAGSDDDDASGGSEDDMFFDKTAGKEGGKRKRRVGAGDGGKGGKGVAVEDAASLFGKLEALKEEKGRLVAALAAEEAAEARRGKGKEPVVVEGVDSLDAFMSSVAATIESDKAAALKKDLQAIIDRIEDTQRLLALADPDQYFKPGSKIADAAVQRAKRALELEKQRRRAEEAQQKQAQAAKQSAAAPFLEETEDQEAPAQEAAGGQQASNTAAPQKPAAAATPESLYQLGALDGGTGGLEVRRPPAPAVNAPPSTGPMASEPPMASHSPKHSSFERRREHIAAALAAQKAGTQTGTARTGDGGSGGAVAAVMADLAVLQKARRDAGVGEGEGEGGNEEEWRPPEGQTGDGKTRLNEALGY